MPQLDIYTYFTQFQWLLVVFTLIFILINGNFVPTFQSLFVVRNFIGTLFGTDSSTGINSKQNTLREFSYEKGNTNVTKKTQDTLSIVTQWDAIYEKYRLETAKFNSKKLSNKVNESKKTKSGKKKITSTKK